MRTTSLPLLMLLALAGSSIACGASPASNARDSGTIQPTSAPGGDDAGTTGATAPTGSDAGASSETAGDATPGSGANVAIALATKNTSQYLSIVGSTVTASDGAVGAADILTLTDLTGAALGDGDRITLTASDGGLLSAVGGGGGALSTVHGTAGPNETFVIHRLAGAGAIADGDEVAIESSTQVEYVSALNGGGSGVTCDEPHAQAWETFVLRVNPKIAPPPPTPVTDYAPYFFTWDWGGGGEFGSLADLYDKHGLTGATIAFVLADGGKCSATRDTFDNLADAKAFMSRGGQLKASFGGADGDYLDYTCGDAASFAKAIEDFVDGTGVTELDFDIEQGSKSFNDTVNQRRAQALAQVQRERPAVKVSFTLAAGASSGDGSGGLTDEGKGLLSACFSAGVKVSHVNLMLMDYGSDWVGKPLAPPSIGALTDANAQLRTLDATLSESDAWKMLGATPMIGVNDDGATFSLDDARSLASFVKDHQLGLVAFWGINRDFVCTSGKDTCSMVDPADFAFHDILEAVH
jgi:hypothetical protein